MEEGDINTPIYYVMGRGADVEAVQRLLSITPCFHAVAHTPEDKSLLENVVTDVVHALDANACREIAAHVARTEGRPVLIAGEGKNLKAVYSTGEEEKIC